ncbi:MAG TPA: DUF4097 family beta strand repeat-containing protein [Gemmatimonadales bacterium]
MRSLIIASAALGLAVTAGAQGRPDFEFRRELPEGRRLYVQNINGDVRVTGGSGRTVEVTAVKRAGRHGDPADVTVEAVELDNGVAICVRYPGQRRRSGNGGRESKNPCSSDWESGNGRNDTEVDFTVRVPAGLLLHAGTVSGDLAAESLEGDLDLQSVSGNATLRGGRGTRVNVETVSGDVELLDVRASEVSGNTVSGGVTFRGPLLDRGSYEFTTTSGDISLGLTERPNATLSAATFSGSFTSDIPVTMPAGRRRHRFDATWGSGSARLDVETLSGDIRITTATR